MNFKNKLLSAGAALCMTVAVSMPATAADLSGKTIEWTIPF